MKYMLLIYNDPARQPAFGTPEFQQMMGGYFALNERLKADGVLRGGEGLKGVETATSLRIKGGKVETMDGPFAETKEHLGGYYIIEVGSRRRTDLCGADPIGRHGTIEVRPLMDYNPAG